MLIVLPFSRPWRIVSAAAREIRSARHPIHVSIKDGSRAEKGENSVSIFHKTAE
ncbi:hypothetical protein ACIBF1_28825 [Spirillospora sp. NPDC050679]